PLPLPPSFPTRRSSDLALGPRRTRHTCQLLVHAEVVLEGDPRERHILALDMHAFFGFDGLMQAFGVAPTWHESPGELIDDDDLRSEEHTSELQSLAYLV